MAARLVSGHVISLRPDRENLQFARAVAENQPDRVKQNRMTSDLSLFTARLREIFATGVCSDALFEELSGDLFRLQYKANEAYRKFCETQRITPAAIEHWRGIPTVPTAAFKELAVTCLPSEQRCHVFHSSGTTEHRPSRHFHSAESLAIYEASLWPWFACHLLPDFEAAVTRARLVLLTPPPKRAPHSSLVHMLEIIRRHCGAPESAFLGIVGDDGAWQLDAPATLAALTAASSGGPPLVLLGTAFSFVHLLDLLAERNQRFKLPPGSRVMETGGYKGRSRSLPKAELHALIADRLGIPPAHIICEYGMSELSSQAYDIAVDAAGDSLPLPRMFRFPPWTRTQIVSPETNREVAEGETGLIRVFDLANVWSVMAIQTEDLGVRRGDGFELFGRATLTEPRGCSLMPA